MDKASELREIKSILEQWAFILDIHQYQQTQDFIQRVLTMLSNCPHPNFEEIKTGLRRKMESKALQLSVRSLMQKPSSE